MAQDGQLKLPDIRDCGEQQTAAVNATKSTASEPPPAESDEDESPNPGPCPAPGSGPDPDPDPDPGPDPVPDDQAKTMTLWDRLSRESESSSKEKPKRFRRLARMVRTNLQWARDMHDKHDEETTFVVKNVGDPNEPLTFNVANFKVSHKTYGGLSNRVRRILTKHPLERSNSDLIVLMDVIVRLKCFSKYSTPAKQELARIIFYDTFDDGRVVIQEGHIGVSFYFIVSGTVVIKVQEIDKISGRKYHQYVGELTEGSTFGELALLHNIRRTATIVCKGQCEFLRVDRDDFAEVLLSVTNTEYNNRLEFLQGLSLFNDWSEDELKAINNTCRNTEYSANEVILSCDRPQDENVFFVYSGECYIVRAVYLLKETIPWGGVRLSLPSEAQLVELMRRRDMIFRKTTVQTNLADRRLWTVCTLTRGCYFGVGENMARTYILTKTKAELVQVPKILFAKYGRSKSLDVMRDSINNSLPTNRHLFQRYFRDRKWRKYKKDVVDEVIQRRILTTSTKPSDVPLVIRTTET